MVCKHTYNTSMQPKLIYALAGELVTSAAHAKRILVNAIHRDKLWIVPQAESVMNLLRAAGQA